MAERMASACSKGGDRTRLGYRVCREVPEVWSWSGGLGCAGAKRRGRDCGQWEGAGTAAQRWANEKAAVPGVQLQWRRDKGR